jgi:hypothetical protein
MLYGECRVKVGVVYKFKTILLSTGMDNVSDLSKIAKKNP